VPTARALQSDESSPASRIPIFSAQMTTPNLTDDDRADLARFLREAIEADRYPLSPRVRRLKALLAKLDPSPVPVVEPLPPPRQPRHA
jgi:hypothetical protein